MAPLPPEVFRPGRMVAKLDDSAFASGTLEVIRRSNQTMPANICLFLKLPYLNWRLPLCGTGVASGLDWRRWKTHTFNARVPHELCYSFAFTKQKLKREIYILLLTASVHCPPSRISSGSSWHLMHHSTPLILPCYGGACNINLEIGNAGRHVFKSGRY